MSSSLVCIHHFALSKLLILGLNLFLFKFNTKRLALSETVIFTLNS